MNRFHFIVDEIDQPIRLDLWLVEKLPAYSRTQLKNLILEKRVTVDGEFVKPGHLLISNSDVKVELPSEPVDDISKSVPLDILFEDDTLIVVNKQPGLVVHPGVENQTGTLVQALIAQGYELVDLGEDDRPGVVHRLDKETSGVIVLAKTADAYYDLVEQFAGRTTEKFYLAVIDGEPESRLGRIEASIGRDVRRPARMAVSQHQGKEAVSEFCVLNKLDGQSLLLVKLLTGRTHQIRVHMEAIGHPVVGDVMYGVKKLPTSNRGDRIRMMLHAWKLILDHPATGERVQFTATPPDEFVSYLEGVDLDAARDVFEQPQ